MKTRQEVSYRWGDWIDDRAQFLGFRRKADLARAVGCTPCHISVWIGRDTPPSLMRKGFDRALARALKTDATMLFRGFRQTAPEDAPIVEDTASALREELIRDLNTMSVESLRAVRAATVAVCHLPTLVA